MIYTIFTGNNAKEKDYLEKMKKSIDELPANPTQTTNSYNSKIFIRNNNKILLIETPLTNRYQFFIVNNKGVGHVAGSLCYNSSKQEEAKLFLDEIFDSLKFN